MPIIDHVTALVIAPPSGDGKTAELYLTDIGEGSLLDRALAALSEWPVDRTVLVLGDAAEAMLDGVTGNVDVLIDPEWEEGPAAALRSGFDLIVRADQSDAVVVVSLDRPVPDAESMASILDTARSTDRPIVAAKYRYAFDYPYLVHAELWGRILGMEGSVSVESLAATHPEWLAEAWVDRVPPNRYKTLDDLRKRR